MNGQCVRRNGPDLGVSIGVLSGEFVERAVGVEQITFGSYLPVNSQHCFLGFIGKSRITQRKAPPSSAVVNDQN